MIRTLDALRALYAQPGERAVRKQLDRLDVHCTQFIALSPFCVIGSAGPQGELLDASPRGGVPGFIKMLDANTLLLPDSGGNNRLDTLENLLRDPRVGLLFLVPGFEETLRVNGTARLRDEAEFVDRFAHERQRPKLVIEVQVAEAYLHCAKAFMRSQLWQPATWPQRALMPSMNEMIHAQAGLGAVTESPAEIAVRYRQQLHDEQTPGRPT